MITLRKLASLPQATRARKLVHLLVQAEKLEDWTEDEVLYWRGVLALVDELVPAQEAQVETRRWNRRFFWTLRQTLLESLGLSLEEWDLQTPEDGSFDQRAHVSRYPLSVYLEDLRSPFNVGSILRTAEAYGFSRVVLSPLCPALDHPRLIRASMGAGKHLKLDRLSLPEIRVEWEQRPVFALELGGQDVNEFAFPREEGKPTEALVLLGSEELGLSPEALEWASSSLGRVSLPLYGKKASLNVGVAFGVLASHWV